TDIGCLSSFPFQPFSEKPQSSMAAHSSIQKQMRTTSHILSLLKQKLFSKQLKNCAPTLFIAHFNFCRVHSAHGKTPAQAAGLINNVWSIENLLSENSSTI